MFCRNCGKELPEDSNFCPNCGKNQNLTNSNNYDIFKQFSESFNNHKRISYAYIVWFILHLTLYITSNQYDSCKERFYPYNMDFLDVLQGNKYNGKKAYIDFLNHTNYYDSTEFFVYVFLIPLIVLALVKIVPYLWVNLKRTASLVKRRNKHTNEFDNTTIKDVGQTKVIEGKIKENNQHTSEGIETKEKDEEDVDLDEYYLKEEIRNLDLKYTDLLKKDISSRPFFKDYYLILGIGTDSTNEDVENAFKREFNNYKMGGKESRRLQDVREAYTILSHQELKSSYNIELMAYNESGDYENYVIKDKQLACIISNLQAYANEKQGAFPKFASKIGKGCLWLIIVILFYFVSTCINAYMTQEGRDSVKSSYSNIESNY